MERQCAKLRLSICRLFPLLNTFYFIAVLRTAASDCPMPGEFRNGVIRYERDNDFNMTVAPEYYVLRFYCNKGYERLGRQNVFCIKGRWENGLPVCTSLSCDHPPDVANGAYEAETNFVIGSTIHYKCDPGFQLANNTASTLTCTLQNTSVSWEGETPVCIEKATCPKPDVSPQGDWHGACCFINSVVRYSCEDGYELVGQEIITCLPGGIWSADRPRCRPLSGHCPDPPAVGNGSVISVYALSDYYQPDTEAEVSCNPGFAYFGISEYMMCTEELEWDVEFGECIETYCSRPEPPLNGKILELEANNQTEFPNRFEVSYVCDKGYRLYGAPYRSCNAGNWTEEEPVCKAIKCPKPRNPENGFVSWSGLDVGQKSVFRCRSGYVLLGSPERYCMPNGQWSGQLTRCNLESNYCPDPGIPENGEKTGYTYEKGDMVQFRCHPGFSLVGSAVRECLSNREWSGEEVKCLGPYDFDNSADLGEKLKEIVNEKAEEQALELEKTENLMTVMINGSKIKRIQTKRILNLSSTGRLIFYFVFDVSGSVKKHNFDTSVEFAKALVKKVGITENGARAAALTFSSKAEIQFHPVQYSTTEDVLKALDTIEYKKGGTATNSALRLVREEVIPLTRERLGRKGLKHIIVILTDGRVNTGGDPEEEAEKLKKMQDVEIYCIGITGSILKNSLYKIASEPTDEHVFILNNYKILEWLIQEITNGTIDYSKCGLGLEHIVRSKQRPRISGGKRVDEPWPWMAALYITDAGPNELELKCGASLVGRRWVLTAAHCLFKGNATRPRPLNQVVVKLGLTDVNNFTYLQQFEPDGFFIHDHYDPVYYDNDIALILLHGMVTFNAYVRPICLPPHFIPEECPLYKANEPAFAAGWGYTEVMQIGEKKNVKSLKNLKELYLPLQPIEKCNESSIDLRGKRRFTKTMLCAGEGKGSGDTCIGDSGGPLMQSQINEDGVVFWTQIGVVSWGYGCNLPGTYGFYAHVHKLLSWINRERKNVREKEM